MKNIEVVRAWLAGQAAVNGGATLRTDGRSLWSYDLLIGDSAVGESRHFCLDYRGEVSHTTSCHIWLCVRLSVPLIKPPRFLVEQAKSQLSTDWPMEVK